MILPVVAYGSPILRKIAADIEPDYEGLSRLLEDMWETMYKSSGVGLAAPQINRSIRLFILDTEQIFNNMEDGEENEFTDTPGFKGVFINARIIEEKGAKWSYNEGCLSIPKIREDVMRHPEVTIQYCDEHFNQQTTTFTGITARVIQHEYDHIEGKLFIDYMAPLKKTLIKRKLDDISKGKIKVDYRMLFHK